jgi:membrane-bound metal-dependent hydrolase YbcI (DUF457 family)
MGWLPHLAIVFSAWVAARAPLACLLAALFFAYLPDADLAFGYLASGSLSAFHKGPTHSFAFALIPAALYLATRRIEFAWGFLGAITHPLIDLVNAPEQLFWPLSSAGYWLGPAVVFGFALDNLAEVLGFCLILVAATAYAHREFFGPGAKAREKREGRKGAWG